MNNKLASIYDSTKTKTALQPEKYQGKEWNPAAFNVYDFGARLYDPALGRWLLGRLHF